MQLLNVDAKLKKINYKIYDALSNFERVESSSFIIIIVTLLFIKTDSFWKKYQQILSIQTSICQCIAVALGTQLRKAYTYRICQSTNWRCYGNSSKTVCSKLIFEVIEARGL